jgi:hypothetical protein
MAGATLTGSCLCGDVAFAIDGALEPISHCHCSICRKAHGTAFGSFVAAPARSFRWLHGAKSIRHFESSRGAHRPFCPCCGSTVPAAPDGERVFIPAGLLDSDPKLAPLPHIFAGSKAPWHEIHDGAPRFEGFPPGWGEAQPTKRATEPAPGVVRGACLCGAVAYEIDAPISGEIVCCHCSRCRKARAAAHATNLFVPFARFRWLRGESQIDSYKVPEAERFTQAFCRDCGSPVPRVNPQSTTGMAVVPAGSLEDDPGVREGAHIFVKSKAPWYAIHDALPQYSEYRPA